MLFIKFTRIIRRRHDGLMYMFFSSSFEGCYSVIYIVQILIKVKIKEIFVSGLSIMLNILVG